MVSLAKKRVTPKFCFILTRSRKDNRTMGLIYWCHYGKNHYNVYMSNTKGFVSNLHKGFCAFNRTQINHLYNYIRKNCGYHSLEVAKVSKVSLTTLKKKLK